MRQRRRAREELQLGLGWYTPEDWERLRQLAADREVLEASYEAWEQGAKLALLQMEVSGRKVQKVPVHIEELSAWCRNRGRPLDAAARAEYVSERLREQER